MNSVPERATVAEKTIQKVARGDVAPQPRKARKRAEKKSGKVTTKKPIDMLWADVQARLADTTNSYTKFEVISEIEVMIR